MSFPVASRRAFLGSTLAGLAALPACAADSSGKSKDSRSSSRPDTLFLTWQRDPTTTMTIQWIGPALNPADATIHYAPSNGGAALNQATKARPFPRSDLTLFRAELTRLHPGTTYDFRIGSHSTVYRFSTMPSKATDTIAFVSGGDCGTGDHAVAINHRVARQDPMFAVIGGDLAYDDGKKTDTTLEFLRNYSREMVANNDRLIPMVPCIGNHEVDGGYEKPRDKAPFFYALFDGLFPETGFASLDFGDYLSLILLDTNHTTPIAGLQTDWLEKTLRARQDHPNVMVVNHVPAYPSHRKFEASGSKEGTGEGNRRHWVPLFEKYRVPVVLEHHDHTFKRTKPMLGGMANANGVLYLGDGSWGKLRAPQSPESLPYLAASSESYHFSLHRIQGEQRFHLAMDEHGRVMDACLTGQRHSAPVRSAG
ncbi:MAG TPA: metallophosphoesterase family protein [Pirellulales bacterium]|nr:metallophosphoesterase family protein [Pirellulales bacterium]